MPLESYVVRIYRRQEDGGGELVGMVEKLGRDGERAFKSAQELWEILSSEPPESQTNPPTTPG